jgi:glycosyltransferase involved in cell wall biosynthesis
VRIDVAQKNHMGVDWAKPAKSTDMADKRKRYFGTIVEPRAGIVLLSDYVNLLLLAKDIDGTLRTSIHVVCSIGWSMESPRQVLKLLVILLRTKLFYPRINFSILANTPKEYRLLRLFGIRATLCHQNCFIDEQIINIKPAIEKKYDAVYNAVLSGFKRHLLAKDVQRLALITYRFENTGYKEYLDAHLDHPVWVNYQWGEEPVFLNNQQLVETYNAACVGLALSAVEGAMYASTEYLLCGIPVVTTTSKGGRDVYFSSDNSLTVEDRPEAVAAAVRDLKASQKDPYVIRERTLERMKRDRAAFIAHVNAIIRSKGMDYDITETWNNWFVHKMRHELYADEIAETLNAAVAPKPTY